MCINFFWHPLYVCVCLWKGGLQANILCTVFGEIIHCVNAGIRFTCIHTVRSARVLTPYNRSQHIQANTRRGFIQSVLPTMGVMMPETCWVNLLCNKHLYLCHLLVLSSPTLMMHGHTNLKFTQQTGKLLQCKPKKGKGKFGPLHIIKACRGVRYIVSVISNVGSTSRLVVNFIL